MTDAPNKFRNSKGNRLTKSLFFEMVNADKSSVLYTLKDQEHEGFPSLYQAYMECGDLTEFQFANAYLDGWNHWEMLCDCSWFKPYVERWRKELHLKVSAKALANIKRIADDREATGSMQANKYLLEKGWVDKKSAVGRPSKDAIKRKADEMVADMSEVAEDYRRMQEELH
jgi:hypothetical protein